VFSEKNTENRKEVLTHNPLKGEDVRKVLDDGWTLGEERNVFVYEYKPAPKTVSNEVTLLTPEYEEIVPPSSDFEDVDE